MSNFNGDSSKALASTLGDAVSLPGQTPYQEALDRVFFSDAALRKPSCLVQPRTTGEVADAIRIASENGTQVTVRGGGLSSLCTADDAVMIDLSEHLDTAEVVGDRVRAGGGATVATILDSLAPMSRVVPVGVVSLAGMGLATRGGFGYLTRSLGPTIDSLEEVELVVPEGDTLRLSDASTGDEADLWWAVRGCAPHFGVVTSATFRSHPLGPVFAHRAVLDLDALGAFFEVAQSLPTDTSLSAVLGPPLGSSEPVLFTYLVYSGDDESGMQRATGYVHEVARAAGTPLLVELAGTYRYLDGLPPMSVPGLDGAEPSGPQPPVPGEPRAFMYSKCRLAPAPLGRDAAEAVAARIRVAPTSFCRIDFQHAGGALGAVADDATAFWGRDSEWNIPWNALWTDSEGDRESCVSWSRETADALAPFAPGVYSVELRPGFPETRAEVDATFGGNLPRLRALKSTWDPNNVLGTYYPL